MGYTKKDAAKDTKSTPKEVSKAWHEARNDYFGSKEKGQRDYTSVGKKSK